MSETDPGPLPRRATRGPHAVGIVTVEVADPQDPDRVLPIDVWYPARAGSSPSAEHPFGRPHAARVGLAPAPGRFPLVAFSHGNSGLRRQSTFLTTHLASWGLVVAAPDHVGNTFPEMLKIGSEEERQRVHFDARRNRPRDLETAIETVIGGDPRWPEVDGERVGAVGHSFGGWTAFKMPGHSPRVRAVCGLAPASEPFVGRKAFEPGELPLRGGLPSLIVAGVDDVLVDLETSVRPLFARLGAPRALVVLESADHFHFCDGVELLHGMHVSNPRPNQPRPTKPYADQLSEERTHRSLQGVVAQFFLSVLVEDDPGAVDRLEGEALRRLDPALRRLDVPPGAGA